MRDDEHGVRAHPDASDDVLHRIFGAALDLSAALRCVEDQRAAAHIRAAIDLLDAATRDLRIGALDRMPGGRAETVPGTSLFIAFHDEQS